MNTKQQQVKWEYSYMTQSSKWSEKQFTLYNTASDMRYIVTVHLLLSDHSLSTAFFTTTRHVKCPSMPSRKSRYEVRQVCQSEKTFVWKRDIHNDGVSAWTDITCGRWFAQYIVESASAFKQIPYSYLSNTNFRMYIFTYVNDYTTCTYILTYAICTSKFMYSV